MVKSSYTRDLPETAYPASAATAVVDDGARSRIAWSAIFAGAVTVIGLEALLNTLGAGIGLSMVDPNTGGGASAGALGAGAGIWLLVSTIISFVVGGFVASWLAGAPSRFDGLLHGVTLWALSLIVTIWLLTSTAGSVLGGVFHIAGGATSLIGKGASAAAPQVAQATGVSEETVQDQLRAYLAPPTDNPQAMTPQDAQKAIAAELPNLAAGGDRAREARARIIPIIAAQEHISDQEAAQRFDAAQAKVQQDTAAAVQKAKEVAQASAEAASHASFATFGALLIGLLAAAAGGFFAPSRSATAAVRRVH